MQPIGSLVMIQLQLVREDIGLQLNSTPDIAAGKPSFGSTELYVSARLKYSSSLATRSLKYSSLWKRQISASSAGSICES